MVANPDRRATVCTTALRVLGREGPRSLTHRAVDREAHLPLGTCSNYFPTRSALYVGMTERLFELLQPDPARLEQLAALPAAEAGPEYVAYIVERLIADPDLGRSWFELRLETARSSEIADLLTPVLEAGFAEDVTFHEARGLSGGADAVRSLHHLVDGLAFEALTSPIHPQDDPIEKSRLAARTLLTR